MFYLDENTILYIFVSLTFIFILSVFFLFFIRCRSGQNTTTNTFLQIKTYTARHISPQMGQKIRASVILSGQFKFSSKYNKNKLDLRYYTSKCLRNDFDK